MSWADVLKENPKNATLDRIQPKAQLRSTNMSWADKLKENTYKINEATLDRNMPSNQTSKLPSPMITTPLKPASVALEDTVNSPKVEKGPSSGTDLPTSIEKYITSCLDEHTRLCTAWGSLPATKPKEESPDLGCVSCFKTSDSLYSELCTVWNDISSAEQEICGTMASAFLIASGGTIKRLKDDLYTYRYFKKPGRLRTAFKLAMMMYKRDKMWEKRFDMYWVHFAELNILIGRMRDVIEESAAKAYKYWWDNQPKDVYFECMSKDREYGLVSMIPGWKKEFYISMPKH